MRLLEMSISAGVLILLLAVLRRGNIWSLAKRTIMVLWMVVLARLLLPGSLPVRNGIAAPVFSLVRRICSLQKNRLEDAGGKTVVLVPEAASSGTAGAVDASLLQQAAGWFWLVGMACVCIYFAYSFLKEYRLLAQALPLESIFGGMPESKDSDGRVADDVPAVLQRPAVYTQILESCATACRLAGMRPQKKEIRIFVHDRIRSPLVFGIIRQKIVIPKSLLHLGQAQMQYVLTHEMVHIRRHDNLWKLLSAAAVCIHWFNPAVWLMYVLSARDLELSCDEQVLSVHGSRGRQEYAMTLLELAQNQKGTTLFCSGFLENPVKERIVAIMKYRKLTGIGVLCAVMLFAGASSVFATNEQSGQVQDAEEAVLVDASGTGTHSAAGEKEDVTITTVTTTETTETEAEKANASGAKTEKAGKYIEKDGTASVIVNGKEESYYVEFHPDVDMQAGEVISVKFDSKIELNDSDEWRQYSIYMDEDGVAHIKNGAGEELEKGMTYELDADDGTVGGADDGSNVNSSSDETMDAVLVEDEAQEMQSENVNTAK